MTKRTREEQRAELNIAQVISNVPLPVRDRVDQLARQERVSRSEIGRRAITQYVERQRKNDGD